MNRCHACDTTRADVPDWPKLPMCAQCAKAWNMGRRCAEDTGELAPLVERMAKGRAKYPTGCTLLSLTDEAGEMAHAVNKGEPVDRVRDELLDVATVAMRLYLGEVDTEHDVVDQTQRALRERAGGNHG